VLSDEGVEVLLRARIDGVRRAGEGVAVVADVGHRRCELTAERLLVATGRRPNTDDLGLEQVGVETDAQGWIVVDPTLRTTASHVYAAGDAVGPHGGSQLATPVGAPDGGSRPRTPSQVPVGESIIT